MAGQVSVGWVSITARAAVISIDGTATSSSTTMWWAVSTSGSSAMNSPGGFWSRTAPRMTSVLSSLRVGADDVRALMEQLEAVVVRRGEDFVERRRHAADSTTLPGAEKNSGGGCLRQGLGKRVPGQRGALDAHRELDHSLQRFEVAELEVGLGGVVFVVAVVDRFDRHHPLEPAHQRLDLVDRLALDRLAHHRRRALGDRATLPADLDIADDAVVDLQVDVDLVATERI